MTGFRIPLSVPSVGPREHDRVSAALASGWVAPAGPDLARFEAALAARTGRRRAVVVASGTAALHLQALACGLGPGDRVAVPTLTFVATANAVGYTGATPVFVDVGPDGTMDPLQLARALGDQERRGTPITAVLPVDLYGRVADHRALGHLADRHGAILLVDAAESLGSRRDGRPAGSHGRAAAVSFNGNKIVTASSGGVVLTDEDALADRVLHLATQARRPVPHYEHHETGYNYRLSNLLAALGHAQLERLDEFVAARRAHRERYRSLCRRTAGLRVLGGRDDAEDNCWLTVLELDPGTTRGNGVGTLLRELTGHGIEARRGFSPLHRQRLFADEHRFPRYLSGRAEDLAGRCLAVPSSPASSAADVEEVCAVLDRTLRRGALDGVAR